MRPTCWCCDDWTDGEPLCEDCASVSEDEREERAEMWREVKRERALEDARERALDLAVSCAVEDDQIRRWGLR